MVGAIQIFCGPDVCDKPQLPPKREYAKKLKKRFKESEDKWKKSVRDLGTAADAADALDNNEQSAPLVRDISQNINGPKEGSEGRVVPPCKAHLNSQRPPTTISVIGACASGDPAKVPS